MLNKTINSRKVCKIALIVYAAIFLIGIVFSLIAGPKFDINFRGGTIITYTYNGTEKLTADKVGNAVKDTVKQKFTTAKNTSFAGDTTFTLTFTGRNAVSANDQENITTVLNREFAAAKYSYQYVYTGKIDEESFKSAVAGALGETAFTVKQSTAKSGEYLYTVTVSDNKWLTEAQETSLTAALSQMFADNEMTTYDAMALYSSNAVSASMAGTFLLKSLVAVLITAALVVLYVGIRFRKIGGVSAALTAFVALVLDLLVTFFVCVIFRLEIDSNYMAVVLTILGYSLNDTIVVYDRVRENKKLYPNLTLGQNMNQSISGVLSRNIVTSVTTVLAVITIIVVSELFGLSSLRTFAIPMAFGLLSGCVSSLFVAGPLWVLWREKKDGKQAK